MKHRITRIAPPIAGPPSAFGRFSRLQALAAIAAGLALAISGCNFRPAVRYVRSEVLQHAPAWLPDETRAAIVADPDSLRAQEIPLGGRLTFVQARTAQEWESLRRCAPDIGACPDLLHGVAVGVVASTGLPLDGHCPLKIVGLRTTSGAGMLHVDYEGGTFLADGTTYLELAIVPIRTTILIVDVNGSLYYPQ